VGDVVLVLDADNRHDLFACSISATATSDERNVPFQQTTDLVEKLLANGANGIRDIEGKVAREAMSECGQRASFKAFGV
jgi:hypothetical protein